MIVLGIFIAVSVLGGVVHLGPVSWAIGAVAALIYWRHDVRRRPTVACRVCSGGGLDQSKIGGGKIFRRPAGSCWCCGGRSIHPRLALRVFDQKQYQAIKGETVKGRGKITR